MHGEDQCRHRVGASDADVGKHCMLSYVRT
jgi:hypothetical protein